MKRFWKKTLSCLTALLVILCAVTSCSSANSNNTGKVYQIYYVEPNGDGLISENYTLKTTSEDMVEIINELFERLQMKGERGEYLSPLEAGVEVSDFQIKETQLSVYFSVLYNNRSGIDEILSRAAIVKTLCQVEGVEYVEFYVEDQPLMLSGNAVGLMNADYFVDNLDPKYTEQNKQVTLYFSDDTGKKLVEVSTEVAYNSSESLAELLVEQLIAGPSQLKNSNIEDLLATVPAGTKLNNLTIRDNICYLDLSSEFTYLLSEVHSDVVVYSIVNTLCELSNITKVQFTINGEQQETYGDTKDFNTPFERSLDMIQGGEQSRG